MTETDDVWARAVEAGAEAIFDEEGPECIDDDGAEALAEVALRAALPVLLADLAAKIDRRADFWGYPACMASFDAAGIVRSFASEVSRG